MAVAPVSAPLLLGVAVVSSLLLFVGGATGGGILGNKLVKPFKDKLFAKTNRNLQKIKGLSVQASATMDTVLEKNIKEIPFEKIKTIPGITAKYTAAAAKQFAADQAAAEAASTPQRKTGTAPRS